MMRLCDIIDIKSVFMEKTDLSEEEIQVIIDDIPTAYDVDSVVGQLEEYREEAEQFHVSGMLSDIIEIVKGGGVDA